MKTIGDLAKKALSFVTHAILGLLIQASFGHPWISIIIAATSLVAVLLRDVLVRAFSYELSVSAIPLGVAFLAILGLCKAFRMRQKPLFPFVKYTGLLWEVTPVSAGPIAGHYLKVRNVSGPFCPRRNCVTRLEANTYVGGFRPQDGTNRYHCPVCHKEYPLPAWTSYENLKRKAYEEWEAEERRKRIAI